MTADISGKERFLARAQALHEIAAQEMSKADQASDPQTRQFYTSAAKAYSQWAVEVEKTAMTVESIERSAHAAAQKRL